MMPLQVTDLKPTNQIKGKHELRTLLYLKLSPCVLLSTQAVQCATQLNPVNQPPRSQSYSLLIAVQSIVVTACGSHTHGQT